MNNISTIIPTYNSSKYIVNTLNSLLNQIEIIDEIIIVDDNSRDDTCKLIGEIISKNRSRTNIKLIKNNQNMGSSYCRNLGIKESGNNLILFFDHDDLARKDMVYKLKKKIIDSEKEKKNISLVYSAYQQIDEDGNKISEINRGMEFKEGETLGYEFVRNLILSNSGVLIKREYIIRNNGFDEKYLYSQDWDLWIRLAAESDFLYVDEPLVMLRRHNSNTSSSINGFINDEKSILNKYSLDYIKDSIFRRSLSEYENYTDFISVLIRLEYEDIALKLLNDIKDIYKEGCLIYFYLGIVYSRKKNTVKALQYYNVCLRLDHESLEVKNNIACMYMINGKLNKSKELLEEVINKSPNYMDARYNYNLLKKNNCINFDVIRITSRKLRKSIIRYSK